MARCGVLLAHATNAKELTNTHTVYVSSLAHITSAYELTNALPAKEDSSRSHHHCEGAYQRSSCVRKFLYLTLKLRKSLPALILYETVLLPYSTKMKELIKAHPA